MELDHISPNTESMETLIRQLNQILDTIAIEFNTLEIPEEKALAGEAINSVLQSVSKKVVGKNFKMGTSNATTVGNNSLFVDGTDSKLKFKDKNGITTSLT